MGPHTCYTSLAFPLMWSVLGLVTGECNDSAGCIAKAFAVPQLKKAVVIFN